MKLIAPAYAGCGTAAIADGPLPFGDIVGAIGATLLTVGAIGFGIYNWEREIMMERIELLDSGWVNCRSAFYSSADALNDRIHYSYKKGINYLCGEIDSGAWAVSYYLSMYPYRTKDFVLYRESDGDSLATTAQVLVNGEVVHLCDLSSCTCYFDAKYYPLFSSNRSVRRLVEQGIRKNSLPYTVEQIKDFFALDSERFERPIKQVGNERIRAMAAVAVAHGKEIFCFPWMSQKRIQYFQNHLTITLNVLKGLGKTVIFPMGKEDGSVLFEDADGDGVQKLYY